MTNLFSAVAWSRSLQHLRSAGRLLHARPRRRQMFLAGFHAASQPCVPARFQAGSDGWGAWGGVGRGAVAAARRSAIPFRGVCGILPPLCLGCVVSVFCFVSFRFFFLLKRWRSRRAGVGVWPLLPPPHAAAARRCPAALSLARRGSAALSPVSPRRRRARPGAGGAPGTDRPGGCAGNLSSPAPEEAGSAPVTSIDFRGWTKFPRISIKN